MRNNLLLTCLFALLIAGSPNNVSAEVFEVSDYGALCDGIADDRLAIQAAIDAAAVTGGRVLFPAGTCVSGGEIKLFNLSGVYLEGKGRGVSEIRKMPGAYSGGNSLLKFVNAFDSGLREMTINGNRDLATGGTPVGVNIYASTGIGISEVGLVEHFNYGVYVSGTSSSKISVSNSHFSGISGSAVYLGPSWSDVLIDGNIFESVDGRTIHYHGGQAERLVLTRNTFRDGEGGEAIFFNWGHLVDSVISDNVLDGGRLVSYSLGRSTISDNQFKNSSIRFQTGIGEPLIVANNTIEAVSDYGITLNTISGTTDDALQVSLIGNRILSDYGGVSMTQGKNVSVVGNSIAPLTVALEGALGNGIYVWGLKPIEGLLIANNQIDEMTTGIKVGPYSTYPYDVDTVLVTGNVIRSSVANASGVLITVGPNGQGAMTTNYQVEGNLEVFTTP